MLYRETDEYVEMVECTIPTPIPVVNHTQQLTGIVVPMSGSNVFIKMKNATTTSVLGNLNYIIHPFTLW